MIRQVLAGQWTNHKQQSIELAKLLILSRCLLGRQEPNSVRIDYEAFICCWNRCLRRLGAPGRLGPPYAPSAAIRI